MLQLFYALILCQSAIGYVVPEYSNASVENAAVACSISPFGTLPTPLLIRSNNFVYPQKAGQTTLTFTVGQTIDFACPGGKIILGNNVTQLQVTTATCVSDTRFVVNNARYLWRQVRCSTNPARSARYTGKTCETNGREIEIGFAVTTARFLRTMLICFNQANQTTFYTNYDVIPTINQQIRGTARPSWTQGSGFFSVTNVNRLYTLATQRVTINKLLGLPTANTSIIQNNNYFLSRGHLTARSDLFYAAQQNSTFHFLNALPQWQTFNAFNWEHAETDVQDYAESKNVLLQVWTGGYGVTTLPHSTTKKETELYLQVNGTHRSIPVPEYFWKVVYNPVTRRGVALIGVNNPYKTSAQINRFCNDISGSLSWLNWQRNNQERGISWACTVPAFRKIVTNFPKFTVSGLLI